MLLFVRVTHATGWFICLKKICLKCEKPEVNEYGVLYVSTSGFKKFIIFFYAFGNFLTFIADGPRSESSVSNSTLSPSFR